MGIIKDALFIDIQDIKDNSIIDSNVSDKDIKFTLIEVQDTMLEPILGKVLFDKMAQLIKDEAVDGEYSTLLNDYIYKYLISAVVYRISDFIINKVRANGIYKKTGENTFQLSFEELEAMKKQKGKTVSIYNKRMREYLEANKTKFSELNNDEEVEEISSYQEPFTFIDDDEY